MGPYAPVIVLFAAASACGFGGALIGAAFLIRALRSGNIRVHSVDLPKRLLALDTLKVSVDLKLEDGRVAASTAHRVSMDSITAGAVQAWLDDNDLVAQFKGRDFKVPAPANPWKPTR